GRHVHASTTDLSAQGRKRDALGNADGVGFARDVAAGDCVFVFPEKLYCRDYVGGGEGVIVFVRNWRARLPPSRVFLTSRLGRSVGDGTLIGMSATLLGRTQIGKECLIAAGAVVPPGLVVPDRMCVMGVPGKIVRPVTEKELEYMRWLPPHYLELAQKYERG